MSMQLYLQALALIMLLAMVTWLCSVQRKDVSIVDSLWSLLFLAAALVYMPHISEWSDRTTLVFVLVAVWALRLSLHLTIRNWGEGEDRRYQQIRANNSPNFALKSIYIVFGLQGLLAWIISIPLLFALQPQTSWHWLDLLAVIVWVIGFVFEAVGDYQLVQFRRDPNNSGKVLQTGLWRYTRHPNYFGEFCIWWGFYLLAVPLGGWWTIYAPLLMSFLLLKVSGVVMLESDIGSRRPEYQRYKQTTNAFFPGLPHAPQ